MDVLLKIGNWDSVNNNCLLLTTFSSCPISMPAGYLGSSPVLSGYKVTLQSSSSSPSSLSITKFTNPQLTRLSTTLEEEAEENYIAGLWHHDKTGRRWSWLWFWWSWQDMMIVMLHYKKDASKAEDVCLPSRHWLRGGTSHWGDLYSLPEYYSMNKPRSWYWT